MRPICVLAAVLAIIASGVAAQAAVKDSVQKTSGEVIIGTVQEETWEKVRLETKGAVMSLRQEDVKEIRWGDKPSDYRTAEGAFKRGEYKEAAEYFEKAVRSPIGRDWWVKPYSLYYMAESYARMGKWKQAAEHFQQFVTEHATAKHYPEALLGLGEAQLALGKVDAAVEMFDKAMAKDDITNLPIYAQDIYYAAWLQKANALLQKKDYEKAATALRGLMSETEVQYPDLHLQARQKLALVKTLGANPDEGISEFRAIIGEAVGKMKEEEPEEQKRLMEVAASSYNGLGDAYLRNAGAENATKKALMAYLHVVAILADAARPDDLAHALTKAADCFEKIGKVDRAEQLRAELARRFPGE